MQFNLKPLKLWVCRNFITVNQSWHFANFVVFLDRECPQSECDKKRHT